jgi:hypothetical protein
VNKIVAVPTGANDKPQTPVKIVSVVIKRVGPPVTAAPATKKTAPAAKKTATTKQ